MSLLDKINDSISEAKDTDNLYQTEFDELKTQLKHANETNNKNVQEIKRLQSLLDDKENADNSNVLKTQLLYANDLNEKNIKEINELKALISEYNNQINILKQSYNNTIEDLKAQLNFEKEINEKYLTKIVESNNFISENIENINNNSNKENNELLTLVNNNKEELSNSTNQIMDKLSVFNDNDSRNNAEQINNLKDNLINSNSEILNLVNEIKKEQDNNSNKIFEEFNNQQECFNQLNSSEDKIVDLEKLITNSFADVSNLIIQNKDQQDNISSKIIEEINNQDFGDSNQINQITELIKSNNEQYSDNTVNKIIEELSNNSNSDLFNNLIDQIDEKIKLNNEELINSVNNNYDNTKMDILNKLSDDLKNENYVNLKAYKKIKEFGLFDEEFYRNEYNYNLDIDPLLHFIYKGFEENKRPCKQFHPAHYKNSNKNIEESKLNPLVYFVTKGIKEGNIKINDDFSEPKHINKYEIDDKIREFNIRGVKKSKRKPRIIVSLTSIPERINEVQYTLYSLLNQEVKADKVILWLSNEQFPNGEIDLPKEVLMLKQNGLSIRFSDDYMSYTKIIPTLKMYPNDIIVTADDDIYYPSNWLKILYEDYKKNPDTIISQRVRRMCLDNDNNIVDYKSWPLCEQENSLSYLNFATGAGGVLYPPNIFYQDITNDELFLNLCKYSDDIWLWAMAVLNNKKIKIANNKLDSSLIYINPARETNLTNEYTLSKINKGENCINIQLNNVLEKYPEILQIIKNE